MEVKLSQIKKLSLFRLYFLLSLPCWLVVSFFASLSKMQGFGIIDIIVVSSMSIFFSGITATAIVLVAWITGLIKPDIIALKVDQNSSQLKGVFE